MIRGAGDGKSFKGRCAQVCGTGFDVDGKDFAGVGWEIFVLEALFVELSSEFREAGWIQGFHRRLQYGRTGVQKGNMG